MATDYVYALFYVLDGQKDYFYVGRSIDPERRMTEHRYEARTGGMELSRQFIRDLWAVGLDFDHEVLYVTTEDTEFVEDYWINKLKLDGYELTNMKAGDSEPWMGRNYNSVEDFLHTRERMVAEIEAAKNAPKVKIYRPTDVARSLYAADCMQPDKKFISPWMQERMQKNRH